MNKKLLIICILFITANKNIDSSEPKELPKRNLTQYEISLQERLKELEEQEAELKKQEELRLLQELKKREELRLLVKEELEKDERYLADLAKHTKKQSNEQESYKQKAQLEIIKCGDDEVCKKRLITESFRILGFFPSDSEVPFNEIRQSYNRLCLMNLPLKEDYSVAFYVLKQHYKF